MKKLSEINESTARWNKTYYLWSCSNKFIGLCKAEHNVLVTALAKRKDIRYISNGLNKVKVDTSMVSIPCNADYLWEIYKNNIMFLQKNIKKLWMYDTVANYKNPNYVTSVIISRYHRIVFDKKLGSYFEQFLLPKGFLIELKELSIDEMLKYKLGRCKEPAVVIETPFEFPRNLFTGNNITKDYGLLISTNTNVNSEFFRKTCMKQVIEKMEMNGFRFKKNSLYKSLTK